MPLAGLALCALAAAAAAPPVDAWGIDGGAVLTASAPSSNVETQLLPWIALRGGRFFALGAGDDSVAVGVDVTAMASLARDGTSEVAATRALVALAPRFLVSPARVTTTFSALVPYGYAGALVGGGVVDVKAFKDDRVSPIGTWGASLGLGARAAIHGVSTSLELGAGLRDLRFQIEAALLVGYSF